MTSVLALAGGREVGEVRLYDLPRSELRGVVAFAHESEVSGRSWVFVAYDERSRQVGRVVRFGAP